MSPSLLDEHMPAQAGVSPRPLDPQIEDYLDSLGAPAESRELTPQAVRERLRRRRDAGEGPRVPAEDVVVEEDGLRVPCRIYTPLEEPGLALVYLHGGGWVAGDLDTSDGPARRLAAALGARVISVGYRCAPEHRFPAALDDARAAVAWAARGANDLPLVLAGDSAGGALAAVCARDAAAWPAAIAAQLLVYPVTDCDLGRSSYRESGRPDTLSQRDMGWYWDQYLPDSGLRTQPDASPLRAADLSAAAPAVIVLADSDPLRDEGRAYALRLQVAGVPVRLLEYPGTVHGFLGLPGSIEIRDRALAQASEALLEMCDATRSTAPTRQRRKP